jgi:hypothetical protein
LEKQPEQRYPSALALADELQRFRSHEPILARPLRPWQRLAKWARRQPVVATLSGLVLLVTILGFAGVFWQWRVSEGHRAQAERRAETESQARKAKEDALKDVERHLYFHMIGLAERDWHQGNVAAARSFLADCPLDLRNWEWRYLDWRCRSHVTRIPTGGYTVAVHPDSNQLATANGPNVLLWKANGEPDGSLDPCPARP